MAAALDGVRIVDLSRVLAGPWATQLLADLGAEVIKIEHPDGGDETRGWGPPAMTAGDGSSESAYFLAANRGKLSLCVDLASAEGQGLIRDLVRDADVFVENFKVGGLARYGLDAASLRAINPRLVYCSITGFGQDGPRADQPGYDFVIQGMGGLMSVTGAPDGEPLKAGVALVDVVTGLYAANAIQAALLARSRSGRGQHIDVGLFDVQLAMLANQALNYLVGGRSPGRLGNAHPNIVPYQSFATGDGEITVAVGNDRQFRAFCAVLGVPELGTDARFATNGDRLAHRDLLVALIGERLGGRDSADWLAGLRRAGVPAGPINSIAEAFDDPQARHRGAVLSLPHSSLGTVPGVACPVRLSDTPVEPRHGPPTLGEHGDAVLEGVLGLDRSAIERLERRGVIRRGRAVVAAGR